MNYNRNYTIDFKNKEDQNVKVLIEDLLSGPVNEYGLALSVTDAGGGNILVSVSWTLLPPTATGTNLQWSSDGGATWDLDILAGTTSPHQVTIPNGTYLYRLIIQLPGDSITIYLDELTAEIIELTPGGDPLRLIINNNEESKLAPIAGLQLVFQINAQNNMTLSGLLTGAYSDKRYLVTATIEDRPIFKGWLLLSETQEPFMPRPVITLTASDGLASLKNKMMTGFTGPVTSYKIKDYLSRCLALVGYNASLNIVMNIREEDQDTIAADPDANFFNTEYLGKKTFESEPGEFVNAYEVLEKIVKFIGILGQRHGEWWLKSYDEYDGNTDKVFTIDSAGDYDESHEALYEKNIGITENIKFSGHAQMVAFTGPAKFAKLTFRYENPKEVPCNIDFERGDFIENISSTEKKYVLDCWTLYQDRPNILSVTAQAFIKRIFNAYELELERYVVIGVASSLHEQQLVSEFIPVNKRDKFDLNFTVKYNGQIETSSGTITGQYAQVRLYANDGTYYTLEGGLQSSDTWPKWYSCTADFNTNQKYFRIQFDGTDDDTEWRSVGFQLGDCPEVPKEGLIQIVFCHQIKVDEFELHISSLRFEHIPYINGSYKKYTGQYHKVSTADDNNESVDEQVYVGDSPALILKGGLRKWNGSAFVLSGRYWKANTVVGTPTDDDLKPFGYHQIQAVWNQVKLWQRIFRSPMQGIESDTVDARDRSDLPSVFHTYNITDTDAHTNNKKFMLLSCDMDLFKCAFNSATLKECYDTVAGKTYTDDYEFKFITT